MKSYGGHWSALMMLFNDCGATRTELFNQELTKVMKGLKNTSAIFRGAQGARLTEGKDPLPFVVYQKICQWLLEKGDKSSNFCALFPYTDLEPHVPFHQHNACLSRSHELGG